MKLQHRMQNGSEDGGANLAANGMGCSFHHVGAQLSFVSSATIGMCLCKLCFLCVNGGGTFVSQAPSPE